MGACYCVCILDFPNCTQMPISSTSVPLFGLQGACRQQDLHGRQAFPSLLDYSATAAGSNAAHGSVYTPHYSWRWQPEKCLRAVVRAGGWKQTLGSASKGLWVFSMKSYFFPELSGKALLSQAAHALNIGHWERLRLGESSWDLSCLMHLSFGPNWLREREIGWLCLLSTWIILSHGPKCFCKGV